MFQAKRTAAQRAYRGAQAITTTMETGTSKICTFKNQNSLARFARAFYIRKLKQTRRQRKRERHLKI